MQTCVALDTNAQQLIDKPFQYPGHEKQPTGDTQNGTAATDSTDSRDGATPHVSSPDSGIFDLGACPRNYVVKATVEAEFVGNDGALLGIVKKDNYCVTPCLPVVPSKSGSGTPPCKPTYICIPVSCLPVYN